MDAPSMASPVRSAARWTSPHPTQPLRRRRPAHEARGPRHETGAHAETTRRRLRSLISRAAVLAMAVLALADVIADVAPLKTLSWGLATVMAGLAALLATTAVEPARLDHVKRRWQWQAIASASVMFMLMAGGPGSLGNDLLWFTIVLAAACALVATVATRRTVRQDPYGADALLLAGVGFLCLYVAGIAAADMNVPVPRFIAAPGVALFGVLALARSAITGRTLQFALPPDLKTESRLRLMPALTAVGAILVLSAAELAGHGTRASFFGIILLFGLIVTRLLITLVENRHLEQRVESSGVFEEKLRDLGGALIAALDRKDTLELVCRTAQLSLKADSVILWMLDAAADELEAVEVLSSKRSWLLHRRLGMNDPSSVAARVAHTGSAEIVANVTSANHSNAFLNVLLHAQALLAVPVLRASKVQGVLVCIDSRNPSAYGPGELARAELLASQVAVALDNAYQHALQRRRVDELSALYQFAQSAHAALSPAEIVRQLLPILTTPTRRRCPCAMRAAHSWPYRWSCSGESSAWSISKATTRGPIHPLRSDCWSHS